ncbi:MAG: extracellular solute-binding protein [Candidatus Kapaibacterium sp.]
MSTFNSIRTLLLSITSFLLLLLIGCGGEESAEGVNLRFAHFWSEPSQKELLQARIAEFEAQNPGIKVELIDMNWGNGKDKLFSMFNSGQAPDVIELGSDWVAQFASEGVLLDLTSMPGDSLGRFPKEFLTPGTWDHVVYARPWFVGTQAMYVNKGLLKEAGVEGGTFKSWDDVLNAGEQVSAKFKEASPPRFGFGAAVNDEHRVYKRILSLFWSNGGEVLDPSGIPHLNSPENIEALELYLTLARNGRFDQQRQIDQLFLKGDIAFWVSGSWLMGQITKENPDLDYVVMPLPTFGEKPAYSFGGGEFLAIDAKTKQKEGAQKLVSFLTSADQALAFCKGLNSGYIPADLSVEKDPFLQEGPQKGFTDQMKNSRFTPIHPKWLDIERILEEEIAHAVLGDKEAAQALGDAQARVSEELAGGK